MKLKIYQYSIIGALALLGALNIFFIVLTIMLFATTDSIQDNVIFTVSLLFLLAMIVMGIINTFASKKKGSSFIKPLVYDSDLVVNTKFIVFSYILAVLSVGVIVYTTLLLFNSNLFFYNFPTPLKYIIINLFGVVLLFSVACILFPYLATSDLSFSKKNRK